MRAFIGIGMQTEIIEKIYEFQSMLRKYTIEGRWTNKENFHITLKFLGEIQPEIVPQIEEAVKKATKGIKPFYLCFSEVGFFKGNKNIRVLWLGTEESELLNVLHANIEDELYKIGFPKEERKFTSHITIARDIKLKIGIEEANKLFSQIEKKDIPVKEISLYESAVIEGKRKYIPVFTVPLK
jgi:2'-5' RNA ligase